MDDQSNQTQPRANTPAQPGYTPPASGSVMDVRPPGSATLTPPVVDDVSMSSEPPSTSPTGLTEPTNPVPPMATPPHLPPADSGISAGHSMPPAAIPLPKKEGGKAIKIMLIIVIALALIGGAVYFYLKNQDKKQTTVPTATTAQVSPASATDVDQTSKDIDATIQKIDNTTDVSNTDLTDTTLGL